MFLSIWWVLLNRLSPRLILLLIWEELLGALLTKFKYGLVSEPFRAVATIDTLIFPFIFSSLIAPKINSASGSTSALILFTAASTSKSFISLPPVIFTRSPFAPCKVYSSINGLFKANSVAAIALFSPSASPVPIIAFPLELITVSTSAKSKLIIPGLTMRSVMLWTPCFKTSLDKLKDSSKPVASLAILNKFWLGTTIVVSKCFFNSSKPATALRILFGPS